MQTKILKGAVLAEGIAIGKVCLYEEDILEASPEYDISANEAAEEKKRFMAAIEGTKKELSIIYEQAYRNLGAIEAEVFSAHLMILEDVGFAGEIERRISEDLINSESAILKTLKVYEDKFKALPSHYFQERIQDIEDIARRLISNLGLKHEGFMCASCHGKPAIVAAENLTSSLVSGLYNKKVGGIAVQRGSAISHAAILARAMGIPVLINVENLIPHLGCGTDVIIDAINGQFIISPDGEQSANYAVKLEHILEHENRYTRGYAETKDGERVKFLANAGNKADIDHAKSHNIRDIGLFRTEFLFLERDKEPAIEEQISIYKKIIESANGVVTFRLLDIGGDKIIEFLSLPKQENPSLGLRGARIYDIYPEIIDHQIEALLIAKGKKPVNILVPMISTVQEFLSVKKKIYSALQTLKTSHDIDESNLKIGCMIEVPSAVYLLNYLAEEADFLSIGTNDLIQYIMGVDRNNTRLGELASPFQPAVIKVLSVIAESIKKFNKEVVVCGEIASDPEMARILVGFGYRNLSINVHNIEHIGDAIHSHSLHEHENKSHSLLSMKTLANVVDLFAEKAV